MKADFFCEDASFAVQLSNSAGADYDYRGIEMNRNIQRILVGFCLLAFPAFGFGESEPTILRAIDAKVYVGEGTASISYQCDTERERPCPPVSVLKRRALQVARILAMQDVCQQAGIEVNSAMMVVSGRLAFGEIKSKSGFTLKKLEFLDPVIEGDDVTIRIVAEVD